MAKFQHILFPVDFSDRSKRVRPFVNEFAAHFHAKVSLLHVVQIPAGWYGGVDGGYPIVLDLPAMQDAAMSELDEYALPGFPAAGKFVKVGDPAVEIVRFAEENGVDLIMMPTHGYGKFRSLLLGSVTSKVLHDAKCAVWTAAHTNDPALPGHLACKSMVGAIDLTQATVALLRSYAALATEFRAELGLVHAIPGTGTDIRHGTDGEFRRFLKQSAREEIARLQAEAGTDFEVCLEEGNVSEIVRAAAIHRHADLTLIGRGRLKASLGQLRTNAYAILRDSPCPTMTI